MLAWMDAEAERPDARVGRGVVLEPLADEYWHKGATSGNTMAVEELRDDCDGDALLLRVRPNGRRATRARSRASRRRSGARSPSARATRPEGSYTTKLLDEGTPACAQKVGRRRSRS
jgi:hypothetical protein